VRSLDAAAASARCEQIKATIRAAQVPVAEHDIGGNWTPTAWFDQWEKRARGREELKENVMRHALIKTIAAIGLTGAAALASTTPSEARWGPGAVAAGVGLGLVGGAVIANSYYGGSYYGYGYPGYYGYTYAPGYAYGGPAYYDGYAPSYAYYGGTWRPHHPKFDNY
jgi:hypothetical protein